LATVPAIQSAIDIETELVDAYPTLLRRLTLVLRSVEDAEDIAQAAFERAIENQAKFKGGNARAWFITIGLRLAFNELRRRRPMTRLEATEEPSWAMHSDPDLWVALGQLDHRHRAALLLSSLDGYTHGEIGRMLGVPAGTISSWLTRDKRQLRLLLGG
jgi:RNA polymerase sigma-70 factor, ECF subfamily